MTFKKLVLELCRREGKKHQVNVAQMSEIVRCLVEIIEEQFEINGCFEIPALPKKKSKGKK